MIKIKHNFVSFQLVRGELFWKGLIINSKKWKRNKNKIYAVKTRFSHLFSHGLRT